MRDGLAISLAYPNREEGGNFLVKLISTCFPSRIGMGAGGRHPVVPCLIARGHVEIYVFYKQLLSDIPWILSFLAENRWAVDSCRTQGRAQGGAFFNRSAGGHAIPYPWNKNKNRDPSVFTVVDFDSTSTPILLANWGIAFIYHMERRKTLRVGSKTAIIAVLAERREGIEFHLLF